jgi:uncharacterized protein (DUF2236 family)
MDALGRAAALGESVAGAPLRLVGELAAPARGGMQRSVRRAIGIGDQRGTISSDPDESFMAPDGVARKVHGDLAAMVIGGVSALLLQTLHPLAMAGVADHSGYRDDPLGRLRRTAQFVGATTYGTTAQAEAAVAQVLRVHRRVKGIAPDGRTYSAADPKLVTFIHVAEISSFLAASQRYGPQTLSRSECDQYYEEMAPIAFNLGSKWAPLTVDEAESYLLRLRPTLYAGPQARQARDWLVRGVADKPGERAVYSLVVAAAIGVLPGWARRELGLSVAPPVDFVVDTLAVTPLMRMLSDVVRWVMPRPASVED